MNLSNCSRFKARCLNPTERLFKGNCQTELRAVLVGHLCVLAGGTAWMSVRNRHVFMYNTKENTWASTLPENSDLGFGSTRMLFIMDDILFAYIRQSIDMYQFVTLDLLSMNAWRKVVSHDSPIIHNEASGCLIERRNEAIVSYGYSGHTRIYSYSIRKKRWSQPETKGHPPPFRRRHAACSIGWRVFISGGSTSNALDIHILDVSVHPYRWSSPALASKYKPMQMYSFQFAYTRSRLFIYGSDNREAYFEVFSIPENCWLEDVKLDSDWKIGTADYAIASTENKIWVFGGYPLHLDTPLLITPK